MTIEKLAVYELLERKNYEGIVVGIPTGMYADRESYGNAPMLAFILNHALPCKIRARPYSSRHKVEEGKFELEENEDYLKSLIKHITNIEFDDENEKLGIAAAFIDQAIRNEEEVEAHGKYENNLFNVNYLKVRNYGFEFSGYKFIFEEDNLEESA